MELILLENIRNLGSLGKRIKVKPGYARNYLLPQKKAVLATASNIKHFEDRKAELQNKELERIKLLEQRAAALNGIQVELEALVSEEGKLYGSIVATDIVAAISAAGHDVKKQEVLLPHGAIRELGLYEVKLGLNHGEMQVVIAVNVVAKSK